MKSLHDIRTYRRRYALTQEELADLLSISQSRLSRIESDEEPPSLETALGFQVVFDIQPRVQVRRLYAKVEDSVMRQAAELDQKICNEDDWASRKKQRLLKGIVRRAKGTARAV